LVKTVEGTIAPESGMAAVCAIKEWKRMLQYVRKYLLLYYVIALAPTIAFLIVCYVLVGQQVVASIMAWLGAVALLVASTLFASRMMNRAAGKYLKGLLRILNEECDPVQFLKQGGSVALKIKSPFNEWGSLFNSACALAYIDIGERDVARCIVESMRVSAKAAKKPVESGHICLNMHDPVKLLYGIDLAISCLDEAQGLVSQDPADIDFSYCMRFIESERALDIAERDGDVDSLIALTAEIIQNQHIFMRVRVYAASLRAEAFRKLGDGESEKHWLSFIVDYGNRMQAVDYARSRLAALQQAAPAV